MLSIVSKFSKTNLCVTDMLEISSCWSIKTFKNDSPSIIKKCAAEATHKKRIAPTVAKHSHIDKVIPYANMSMHFYQ